MPSLIRTLLASGLAACFSTALLADGGGHHQHPAFGVPGQASAKARVVEVTMDDTMRFSPSQIAVKRGETIRFVVRNAGRQPHEMVLGRLSELKAHAELMQRFPNMQHDEPNMVTVAPGQQASLLWRFTDPGTVDFACLIPGHYEAGMRGTLTVKK